MVRFRLPGKEKPAAVRPDCPTGKSPKTCPALPRKIFRFCRRANQWFLSARLTQMRGGSRSSRTRGGMRWTRKPRLTSVVDADGEVVWSWRPDAGVKFVRRNSCGRRWQKAGHRGERAISRKPLRREGRMLSAELVCSCACCYAHIAHETAGAARTRLSLRPLFFGGSETDANLGQVMPRERGRTSSHRHRPRRRAIQYAAASRLRHGRLWSTGSSAFADDDNREAV